MSRISAPLTSERKPDVITRDLRNAKRQVIADTQRMYDTRNAYETARRVLEATQGRVRELGHELVQAVQP